MEDVEILQLRKNIKRTSSYLEVLFGEPGGVRTPDPRLRRPVLYPAELLTHLLNAYTIITCLRKNVNHKMRIFLFF